MTQYQCMRKAWKLIQNIPAFVISSGDIRAV
jgi:hypothetical protein